MERPLLVQCGWVTQSHFFFLHTVDYISLLAVSIHLRRSSSICIERSTVSTNLPHVIIHALRVKAWKMVDRMPRTLPTYERKLIFDSQRSNRLWILNIAHYFTWIYWSPGCISVMLHLTASVCDMACWFTRFLKSPLKASTSLGRYAARGLLLTLFTQGDSLPRPCYGSLSFCIFREMFECFVTEGMFSITCHYLYSFFPHSIGGARVGAQELFPVTVWASGVRVSRRE